MLSYKNNIGNISDQRYLYQHYFYLKDMTIWHIASNPGVLISLRFSVDYQISIKCKVSSSQLVYVRFDKKLSCMLLYTNSLTNQLPSPYLLKNTLLLVNI